MAKPKHILDRVLCGCCEKHTDIRIPAGTVVIDGQILDCKDKVRDRVQCPQCQSYNSCNSIDP